MKKFYYFLIMFFAMSSINYLNAQQVNTLNGASRIKPISQIRETPEQLKTRDGRFSFYGIAVFNALPDKDQKLMLERAGIRLYSWIEGNSFMVNIHSEGTYATLKERQQQSRNPDHRAYLGILSVGEIPVELKLAPVIMEAMQKAAAAVSKKNDALTYNITVTLFDGSCLPVFKQYATEKGLQMMSNTLALSPNTVIIKAASAAIIKTIADLNYVRNIEQLADAPVELATPNLRNMIGNQIYSINYDTANGYIGRNTFSGNVETISSLDPEILARFRGRLGESTLDFTGMMSAHAKATSSVMAGNNIFDELIDRGMAPGTKSLIQAYWDVSKVMTHYDNGFHPLSINSSLIVYPIGQLNNSAYTSTTAAWDQAIRSVPDLMFAVSAGNNGTVEGLNGYPAGWNNVAYNSSAKNALVVSNVSYPGKASFGCSGPFNDGRIAPQICAEGNGGTSFASPAVAGLISDLFEAYMDSYSVAIPRSDVVKAVMMNTAQDIYKKGPDFKTGYGNINPYEAVNVIRQQQIITGSAAQGSGGTPQQFMISVPEGLKNMKLMLYWHDFQGANNAIKTLVNDLDLKIVTPSGDTVLPWILHPSPSTVEDLATRGIDTLNNQEQVTIDNPVAGNYRVLVYGKQVPMGPQDYVITYALNKSHIKITTPDGYRLTPANYQSADSRKLGSGELDFGFTWDYALNTSDPADSIQVFMQREAGDPFLQIGSVSTRSKDNIDASASAPVGFYLKYAVPADFPVTSTARIMVKQKNKSYSDTSGCLMYSPMPLNLRIVAACRDAVTLQWDALESLQTGGKYIIYHLSGTTMEVVDSVNGSVTTKKILSADLPGADFGKEQWFAVAALQPGGNLSYRTYPVTQKMTDPNSAHPVPSVFTLCKSDTARLFVNPYFINDSVEWYKNGLLLAGIQVDTLSVTIQQSGKYTYKSYLDGCAFESDTFYVNKSPDDILPSDTTYSEKGLWRAYLYKGDAADSAVYGYFDMTSSDMTVYSTEYYSYSDADPWNVDNYKGCPLPDKDFTIIFKRTGFPNGNYTVKQHKGYSLVKMWVNDTLVYVAPTDVNSIREVWSGYLDMDSKVRVSLRSTDHSEIALDFICDRPSVNLALNKKVTQVNTYNSTRAPEFAVDGDYSTFSSTKINVSYPYMNIDLGDSARIDQIRLWNRDDAADLGRLSNYYIFVSNTPFEEVAMDPASLVGNSAIHSFYREQQAMNPTLLPGGIKGRYVRIQLNTTSGTLNVPELEVFGAWLNPDTVQLENLAYLKPAIQSSTYKTSDASRAVDGVVDGKYSNGSTAHTEDDNNPWWMVDLGKIYTIRQINVYNRTDAVVDRLKNYNILISEDSIPMSTAITNYTGVTMINDPQIAKSPTRFKVNDVQGRYIALQIPGSTRYLHLAELQAYGLEVSQQEEGTTEPPAISALTGQTKQGHVLLSWSALNEAPIQKFIVERQGAEDAFKAIGEVGIINGSDSYSFEDSEPKEGVNVYRIRVVSGTDESSFSNNCAVEWKPVPDNNGNSKIVSIQPNPVDKQLRIVNPGIIEGQTTYSIVDAGGRLVMHWTQAQPGAIIEKGVGALAPGVYMLSITSGGSAGNKYKLKFIKM